MSENESSSKDERMVNDSGCDRLSELPSSIMDIILSSISTRDAVRMSILSKQFRYAWISVPHLGFDLSEFSSTDCMVQFIRTVLKLHKGPILKYAISAFRGLIWCDRRSIANSFNKLTRLELCKCSLVPPPLTFRGFLVLRYLILVGVDILPNAIESVVASSPLLETLKLEDIVCHRKCFHEYPELRITAPNLKYLDLEISQKYCMQVYLCAPLLVEMSISIKFDYDDGELLYMRSTNNYSKFFGGCTSLQKLKGNYFTKYSFVLPRLEVIELNDVNFKDVKETSIVARLVAGAPNLKELKLTSLYDEEEKAASPSDVPVFKCQDLRIITLQNIAIFPSRMEFLKLLLENSPTLERLNIIRPYRFSFQEDECLRAEVLKFNIASPNLTIWFGVNDL